MRYLNVLTTSAAAALVAGSMAVSGMAAAEDIKIGYAGGFTGYLAPYDQPSLKGVQLAVDQINAAGGVLGMQIELIVKDTRTDAAQSAIVSLRRNWSTRVWWR